MTSYDQGDVVLATLPFSDLSGIKKRPAVVVSVPHPSVDLLLLPLTPKHRIFSLESLCCKNGKRRDFSFPARSSEGCLPSTEPT